MGRPEVSLVICTRNRADHLRGCLHHLARLAPSCAWELVIVDNGSSDETGALLTAFARDARSPLKLLREEMPGVSRAKNTGWAAASGSVIAFTDDDCYVAPDYIDKVVGAFTDPKVGFAGGRVELYDPADYPITIQTSTQRALIQPRSLVPAGAIHGANMMFRRQVLETIGGFDVDLGPGTNVLAAEDLDAQARASLAGWWGLYTPEPVVAHHHGRTEKDVPALQRAYALGRGAHMAKLAFAAGARSIYLRCWRAKLYRALRRSGYERRDFMWEVQGAAHYVATQARRRIGALGRRRRRED